MLAALNHPNIGAIYGFEEAEGLRFLVLELVDGQTLADKLADVSRQPGRRPGLPIRDALSIARRQRRRSRCRSRKRDHPPRSEAGQHQDHAGRSGEGPRLRPGEDRGAASTAQPHEVADVDAANQTSAGAVLGTPDMSPEQVRGQVVDKRTDIWAFGCVLYEMLTGRAAFRGGSVSDTIAAVLGSEPDWDALPDGTPTAVRLLLQRCLEKRSGSGACGISVTYISRSTTMATPRRGHVNRARAVHCRRLSSRWCCSRVGQRCSISRNLYRRDVAIGIHAAHELQRLSQAPSLSPDGRMVTFKRGGDSFLGSGRDPSSCCRMASRAS